MYRITSKEKTHPKESLHHRSWELSRSPQNQDVFKFSDTHPNAAFSSHALIHLGLMENLFESDTGLTAGGTKKDMSCLEFGF